MVVGIVVYKFELNPSSAGKIDPEFKILSSATSADYNKIDPRKIVSLNDLFGIFFHHTTGTKRSKGQKEIIRNSFTGRLKESSYKVVSHYKQEIDSSQYLIISYFRLDEEAEIFEPILQNLAEKMDEDFQKLAKGNLKDLNFIASAQKELENKLKFVIFQIGRLSNLDKLQKLALIYSTAERTRTLEILREGPVSRKALTYELEKYKQNPNLDIILTPFLELNILRRDWAKGTHNMKTGVISGEGEFLFLVKDAILLRSPPNEIIDKMKKDATIGSHYMQKVDEFFSQYDPFAKFKEESALLAKLLLNPDIFDFLGVLKHIYFPRAKIPKISSEFVNAESLIDELVKAKVLLAIEDPNKEIWYALLCDISPIVIFPEYLISKIQERLVKNTEQIDPLAVLAPLTPEVAQKGLDLLEATYNEKFTFLS